VYLSRGISARKNGAFKLNYSMEQGKIYISYPIDSEKFILNDNLRDVLGFKQNIINGTSAGSTCGMNRVIFADYVPRFTSFVETSRVGNSNIPLLRVLKRKKTGTIKFIITI